MGFPSAGIGASDCSGRQRVARTAQGDLWVGSRGATLLGMDDDRPAVSLSRQFRRAFWLTLRWLSGSLPLPGAADAPSLGYADAAQEWREVLDDVWWGWNRRAVLVVHQLERRLFLFYFTSTAILEQASLVATPLAAGRLPLLTDLPPALPLAGAGNRIRLIAPRA